ncbi:MAG TPA: LD-carboxypeptidase [Vicinamibacterales bacterium]|jgi:muramoyltetrapeptide carboxypeptidase
MTTPLISPPRLVRKDKVALISPASPPKSRSLFLRGKTRLEQLGLSVVPGSHALAEHGYLAGSDQERRQDLEAAFRDPDIKAIFCSRGGYGVSRLLPGFDLRLARRHPKAVIGFSDITVLHLALQKAGLVSFWGPMPCTDSAWTSFSLRSLERALMSPEPVGRVPFSKGRPPKTLRPGIAHGPLTGGTLSLLTASLGTDYEVETCGRVVFIEDVGEEPYKVDRMLTQLMASGKLSDAAGLALGIFTDTEPRNCPARHSFTLHEVIADRLLPLKIPILANLAVGHVPDQLTLPYGIEVRLNARARTLELLQPGVA